MSDASRAVSTSGILFKGLLKRTLPAGVRRALKRETRRLLAWPPVGRLSFGSLERLTPISNDWGFERGLPIDRYYIEKFLSANSGNIAGCVAEIGDPAYTRKFGDARLIKTSDVIHVQDGLPDTTIVADLTNAPHLAPDQFDCIICTQTLNFIYDFRAALQTIHRIAKPGGVVLLTAAGISQISDHDLQEWGDFWRFTSHSLTRACNEIGVWKAVDVKSYGNVLSSTAFLYGIATQELSSAALDHTDEHYQLILGARLLK